MPFKRIQMARLKAEARGFRLELEEEDGGRPWGGFLRFRPMSLPNFQRAYWPDVNVEPPGSASVDPKVLLVAPGAMLSLQWHKRRSEKWRVIDGPVCIIQGDDWNGLTRGDHQAGDIITLGARQWHRLIGLACWGRVAEYWEHTDPNQPSDERDVLRVHDIYGRADDAADRSPVGQREALWKRFYQV